MLNNRRIKYYLYIINRLEGKISKSLGLEILSCFGLSVPPLLKNSQSLKDHSRYSIRTSFPIDNNYCGNNFYKSGLCMPSIHNIKYSDLKNNIKKLEDNFKNEFYLYPDILIHQTYKIIICGNVLVDNETNEVVLEIWDDYNKNEKPLKSIIFNRNKIDEVNIYENINMPEKVFNLPLRCYNLEWILSRKKELLFTEINILNK